MCDGKGATTNILTPPIPSTPATSPGKQLIGTRAYRVLFALGSLPLAVVAIVYFINHRYDGVALWDLRGVPGMHSLVGGTHADVEMGGTGREWEGRG